MPVYFLRPFLPATWTHPAPTDGAIIHRTRKVFLTVGLEAFGLSEPRKWAGNFRPLTIPQRYSLATFSVFQALAESTQPEWRNPITGIGVRSRKARKSGGFEGVRKPEAQE